MTALAELIQLEIIAKSPSDIARAYTRYYAKLAEAFVALISVADKRTVLEAGCGKGQLTIPLIERLPKRTLMIGVDSSRGPYAGWLPEVVLKVNQLGVVDRIRLIRSDARRMKEVASNSIDALVSNELICDLTTRDDLNRVFKEFRRVLRPGGIMIHGEWSSWEDHRFNKLAACHSPAWNPDQLF